MVSRITAVGYDLAFPFEPRCARARRSLRLRPRRWGARDAYDAAASSMRSALARGTGVRGRRAPPWRAGGSCSSTTTSRRSVRLRKVAGDLVAVDDRSLPRAVVEPDERTSTASAPVTPPRRGRMWHYILTMPRRMRRWRSKRSANVKDSNCAEDPILLAHVPAVLMQAVGGRERARLRARRDRAEGDRPRPASPAATTSRERAATSCRETRHARCGLPE